MTAAQSGNPHEGCAVVRGAMGDISATGASMGGNNLLCRHCVCLQKFREANPMRKERPEKPGASEERRVRGEFYEMPGLRLTVKQACRLWQLDVTTCEDILASLVSERVLRRSADGHYASLPTARSARTRSQIVRRRA